MAAMQPAVVRKCVRFNAARLTVIFRSDCSLVLFFFFLLCQIVYGVCYHLACGCFHDARLRVCMRASVRVKEANFNEYLSM